MADFYVFAKLIEDVSLRDFQFSKRLVLPVAQFRQLTIIRIPMIGRERLLVEVLFARREFFELPCREAIS